MKIQNAMESMIPNDCGCSYNISNIKYDSFINDSSGHKSVLIISDCKDKSIRDYFLFIEVLSWEENKNSGYFDLPCDGIPLFKASVKFDGEVIIEFYDNGHLETDRHGLQQMIYALEEVKKISKQRQNN